MSTPVPPPTAVPAWFAVGPPKIVVTAGIPSAEAFGHPLVAYLQNIVPSGIPSAAAVGTPTVTRGAVILRPTGIPSEQAVGTPALTYFVAPTGIPSAAAFGTPTVIPGATTLIPSGIPSEEAFGTPTMSVTAKPTGIPSGEAFGIPTVVPGPVTVTPAGIASAEAFGTPAVTLTSPSVLFDALGAGNSVNVQQTNLTISHTATPGSKVIVWIAYANSAGVASMAATYAGQNMTAEGPGLYLGATSYYNFLQCFSYPAALSGAQSIVFTAGYTSFMKANSISYLNANQSDVPKTNTGTGTALSVPSVASAARHLVSNAMLTPAAVAALTAYNQTSRWNVITGAWPTPFLIGDASGAATVSFSANQASSAIWGGEAIDLWNAPVYLVGSAAALANTVAFPAHQVGDLLVVCCIDVVSTTGVTKPAAGGTVPAWVDIETLNTTGGSIRIAQFKATGTNHTTGSWGTASQCYMAVAVIRGQNATTPVGGHGSVSATSANSTAPAITLSQNDGSSLILCFHHIRLNYTLGAAPVGYSRRALDPSANRICLNTKNNSTTDGAIANPCTGSDFTIASQIEIVR